MSDTPRLPVDPAEDQRLLDDLLRRNDPLRQQVEAEQRRADAAQRRLDELERVLDQTAADFDHLKEKHAELAELLALFRRYLFGPRRERRVADPTQGHLFGLHDTTAPEAAAPREDDAGATAPRPRTARPPRRTRLDHLPQIRIEHDLPEDETIGSCCVGD
jgi:transposase